MAGRQEALGFIRSTFRSVWTLELLFFLQANAERSWSHGEMVRALRGSDLVVSRGVEALVAAGLVLQDKDGRAGYHPVSADIEASVVAARELYTKSPDIVRRTIVTASSGSLAAFADAFRLRKD